MSSPQRPLIDYHDVMFWLPPGGTDNGVFASNWAELADLDLPDGEAMLDRLAAVGVGGYLGTPGGRRSRNTHRLWVDSLQYHHAEDVLMCYLHDRDRSSLVSRKRRGSLS